ncbi:hypothetical protein D3C81_08840 [compost metagenome]
MSIEGDIFKYHLNIIDNVLSLKGFEDIHAYKLKDYITYDTNEQKLIKGYEIKCYYITSSTFDKLLNFSILLDTTTNIVYLKDNIGHCYVISKRNIYSILNNLVLSIKNGGQENFKRA